MFQTHCVSLLMWEMHWTSGPCFVPIQFHLFSLRFISIVLSKNCQKEKTSNPLGEDVCVSSSFTAIFFVLPSCFANFITWNAAHQKRLFYLFCVPWMWYFSPSFPHCALRQFNTIGENKTKKQQFYKTDLCTTAWRNILHLERLNLQGDEIGVCVCLTFPALAPIRRKAIGNGEIREVIEEFGGVLIIIMSATGCVCVF